MQAAAAATAAAAKTKRADLANVALSVFHLFSIGTQLVELRRNPAAGEQRVRATLKPLKKSRRDSDSDSNANNRIKQLQDDNLRCKTRLEEVTSSSFLEK